MATYCKWFSKSVSGFKMSRISKCSVYTLSKFTDAMENDTFWLKRLDHKDWLAPKEVIKVFTNLRNHNLIMHAFEKASARMDYKPCEALYSLLIDRLAYAQNFCAIDELLVKAKFERCKLSDEFFYKVIKIYGNVEKNQKKATEMLFWMREFHCLPTVKIFNYVLNLLVNEKQFEAIHEVFLSAPRLGVTIDTCCFNILIKGLCQMDKFDAAFSLLDEIPKHRRRPNAKTYSTLMHYLCKKNRVTEAFDLLDRMEKEDCYPDTIMFNILASGLCKQGRLSEGMEILKKMKLKGCYPNSGTYQALLYGLLSSKKFVEAKDFMGIMLSEGKCPSFLSYKRVIEGLCDENLYDDVDLVLRKMVQQGFVPRAGTWKKIVGCMFQETACDFCLTLYTDSN